jgi:hypothetical protein
LKNFSSLGSTFLFRIFFPGALWTILLTPLIKSFATGNFIISISTSILIFGMTVYFLEHHIYWFYEGRMFWLPCFREARKRYYNIRIDKRIVEAKKIKKNNEPLYNEIWNWLRMFPINSNGERKAISPTRLGNIIQEYELYPWTRYKMDSVFYWYRIWLIIDDKTRKEIDRNWAQADCLLYCSFVFLVSFLIYLVLILYCAFFPVQVLIFPLPSFAVLIPLLIGSLAGSYITYIISIPWHRCHGEYFKALFDVFREKILNKFENIESEKAAWEKAQTYLQYLKIKCPKCEKYHYVGKSHTCNSSDKANNSEVPSTKE